MAAPSDLPADLSPQRPTVAVAAAGIPDSRQLDLLRIVCCVAWADGEVSAPERQLLAKLTAEYFLPAAKQEGQDASWAVEAAASQLAAWAQDLSVLDEVIPRLRNEEDRLLAIKLAYMMASIGRQPGIAPRSTSRRSWPIAGWWKALASMKSRCRRRNGPLIRTWPPGAAPGRCWVPCSAPSGPGLLRNCSNRP